MRKYYIITWTIGNVKMYLHNSENGFVWKKDKTDAIKARQGRAFSIALSGLKTSTYTKIEKV